MSDTQNGQRIIMMAGSPPDSTALATAFAAAKPLNKSGKGGDATKLVVVTPAVAPATPARRSLAEIRAARMTGLAIKVAINPEVTEALGILANDKALIEQLKVKAKNALADLKSGEGEDFMSEELLQQQILAQEDLLKEIELSLAQNKVDSEGLMSDDGLGIALALIARGKLKKQLDVLVAKCVPVISSNIATLVEGVVMKLGILAHGAGDGFRWGHDYWVSAVAGDPSALGFIPTIKGMLQHLADQQARRVAEAGEWLLNEATLRTERGKPTSLSDLLAGSVGYCFVPVQGVKKAIGTLVVEGDGKDVFITHTTSTLLVEWALENKKGERSRRPVKFRADGSFEHSRSEVRTAFENVYKSEEPMRAAMAAGKATMAELDAFAASSEGKKFPLSTANIAAFLRPTTAGAGLWLVEASHGGKSGPRTNFGIVLKKAGKGKVEVIHFTTTTPEQLLKEPKGPFSVSEMPRWLRATMRSACYLLGMKAGFPAEIQKG